ncbi:hypothetical protein HPB47_027552 [Ixodes persulcatus]|uniref:Uncharacterized protein n=1 Tax=Ixodes persulcatus TaxID=34615 RepID=A0AC60PVJ0_IXOPE|nr:hypothetical protein HPB47_027552 [Ixodes persulcatus]
MTRAAPAVYFVRQQQLDVAQNLFRSQHPCTVLATAACQCLGALENPRLTKIDGVLAKDIPILVLPDEAQSGWWAVPLVCLGRRRPVFALPSGGCFRGASAPLAAPVGTPMPNSREAKPLRIKEPSTAPPQLRDVKAACIYVESNTTHRKLNEDTSKVPKTPGCHPGVAHRYLSRGRARPTPAHRPTLTTTSPPKIRETSKRSPQLLEGLQETRAFATHVFFLPVDPDSEASFAILPRQRCDERQLPSTKSGPLDDGPRVFERFLRGSAVGRVGDTQ